MEKQFKIKLWGLFIAIIVLEVVFWATYFSIQAYYSKFDNFLIEHPERLIGFAFLLILPIVFLYQAFIRNRSINRLASINLLPHITSSISTKRIIIKYTLLRLAFGLLVIAASNPQFGHKEQTITSKGIDIIVALDVSNSMLARDLSKKHSRLDLAKKSIQRLLDKLHGDRIGIVVFAGDAFVQLPITSDYKAAKSFLPIISTDLLGTQGTALGRAIEVCIGSFDYENGSDKSIILISDGENHEDEALEFAKKAEEKGIVIHSIGMGSPKGSPIQILDKNGIPKGVRRDQNGNTIITKLNEEMLQNLARTTNGSYTRAKGNKVGLNAILDELQQMEKAELGEKGFLLREDQFHWFLGAAIFLLLLESLISYKRNSFFQRLKITQTEI